MRFDVKTWPELDRAIHDYREAMSSEPLILVFHASLDTTFRFIIGQHGIIRQECNPKGDLLE